MAKKTRITCPKCKGSGGRLLTPVIYEVCPVCKEKGEILWCKCTGRLYFVEREEFTEKEESGDDSMMVACSDCDVNFLRKRRIGYGQTCSRIYYETLDGEKLDRRDCEGEYVPRFYGPCQFR